MTLEERRVQVKQPVTQLSHSLTMENREKLCISGVEDVDSFNDTVVVLQTNMGLLTIKGEDLHINKLNVENGELLVEGGIDSCEYSDNDISKREGSFFSRLFR